MEAMFYYQLWNLSKYLLAQRILFVTLVKEKSLLASSIRDWDENALIKSNSDDLNCLLLAMEAVIWTTFLCDIKEIIKLSDDTLRKSQRNLCKMHKK